MRQPGILFFIAAADFNTGLICAVSSDAEILQDTGPGASGTRVIIARVPDQQLDLVIEQLRDADGVIAGPDKSYSAQLQAD